MEGTSRHQLARPSEEEPMTPDPRLSFRLSVYLKSAGDCSSTLVYNKLKTAANPKQPKVSWTISTYLDSQVE